MIILVSIPKVYGYDDDWIDGITFKLTINESKVEFRYRLTEGSKKRQVLGSSGGKYQPAHLSRTTYGFPIAIELKENLMNSWSYRQAYFDWTFNTEYNDMYPNSSAAEIIEGSSNQDTRTVYLRQPEQTRTALLNSFFNSSDKDFTNANPNWALSADLKYSTLIIGYSLGVFYPAYNGSHRWMKVGIGISVFAAQMKVDYNLCSRYEIEVSEGSGGCVGKHKIDQLETQVVGPALNINITFWERKTKDSIWRIGTGDLGYTILTEDREKSAFSLEKHDNYLIPNIEFSSNSIISYTSRF